MWYLLKENYEILLINIKGNLNKYGYIAFLDSKINKDIISVLPVGLNV